jgi:predicted amidophosphoribosyltransferase
MYYRNRKGIKIWALQKRNKFGGIITFKRKGIINFNFDIPEGEFDHVVMIPSSKKLVVNFAKNINKKFGIHILDKTTLNKSGKISKIPINLRCMKAATMFSVNGKVEGKILLIDDYSITGASMVSAANELLKNGAESVTGFCIVIS